MATNFSLASEKKLDGRGSHPNSRKNLKPFPKGVNGNPNPVGYSVSHRLKKMLQELSDFIPPNANPNDKVYRDQIARAILIKSAQGDVSMIHELLDRTEGKVPDPGKGQGEVNNTQINIIVSNDKARELTEQVAQRLLNGNHG